MNSDCVHCHAKNALVVNNTEGMQVCTECGYVCEMNMWISDVHEYEPMYMDSFQDRLEGVPYGVFTDIVLELAYTIYMKKMKEKLHRGNNRRALIASCVFAACQECNVPKTIHEIATLCNVDSVLLAKIGTRVDCDMDVNYSKMIHSYLNHLDLPVKVRMQYHKQISDWMENDAILEGKSPHTKLTTFIYFIAAQNEHIHITKKFIVDTFDISIVTLNKSLKDFLMNHSNL